MDLIQIMKAYIKTMVDTTPGYKSLLVDKDTMHFVSTLFGRTEFAEHNVVNIEKLDAEETKEHLELEVRCPVQGMFVQCTAGSVRSAHMYQGCACWSLALSQCAAQDSKRHALGWLPLISTCSASAPYVQVSCNGERMKPQYK